MKSRLINFNGKPAILSISRNISERKKIQKQIIQTIIKTEEKERKRFAADLHDGLSPILSTIRLYSDLLRSKQESKGKETDLIDNIEELADMAISSAKEIANNLTPQILHDFGPAVAIEEFCRFLNKTKSVHIRVETKDYSIKKRLFAESILFQTTKELINNTIKHAQAKNIFIELKNTEKYIYLYYKDDGIGFDITNMTFNSSGLGLRNIQNKIKTIKGTCDFNSRPGQGMFVLISIGIEQSELESDQS
jgi:signal transduction histidine kinase